MTHKPQSDIFSSLPHLIALANKKELIENNHYTWEEQAMRLQAKMAKLQYLQYLIQPPLTTASSSSSLTDLDTINLLNSLASIKDNSPFHNSSIIQLDISRDGNGAGWSSIASHLPGRTDNEIKNFWNTHLKKKLIQMGYDSMTHKPQADIFSSLPRLIALTNIKKHMENNHYTWEEQAMRLQDEMAKLQYLQYLLQPPLTAAASSSSLTDLDTINLLNSLASIKDNSPFQNSSTIQLDISNSIPFSHMPDLQVIPNNNNNNNNCSSYQRPPSLNNNKDDSFLNSPIWLGAYSLPSSTTVYPPSIVAPPTINNLGNVCTSTTSSNYGGDINDPSLWPYELFLEDPLFHHIA
ncbi:hypothetical protein LWI28_015130 [Acer negundo]|uniref:Uncharacterized protein n=1 Tax=Acer negundo TaxID=4023 RepID=A0AAD5IIK1_ACENE|nr:hypothetical protein LWI28_015130 [Acer negundo]